MTRQNRFAGGLSSFPTAESYQFGADSLEFGIRSEMRAMTFHRFPTAIW
jgi:hypothetical protein